MNSLLGPEAALSTATDSLDEALSVLETALEPYLRPDTSLSATAQRLSDTPLEAARLHASLATGVLSLASCFLRVAGVDVGTHDIKREFASLRTINDRIKTTAIELEKRKEERELRLQAIEAKKDREKIKERLNSDNKDGSINLKKRLADQNDNEDDDEEGFQKVNNSKRKKN